MTTLTRPFRGELGSTPSLYLPPASEEEAVFVPPIDRSFDAELIDIYSEYLHFRRSAPTSIRLRAFWVDKLLEHLGEEGIKVFEATTRELETYLFSNEAWSQNTQQTILSSIRSFYGWATRTGLTNSNPALELAAIRVHRRPARIAGDDAIREGLSRADVPETAMILLGAECGLRVSEIATLSVGNRDGSWLHIAGKGGVRRSVSVSPELAGVLDELERDYVRWGFYFPGKLRQSVAGSTVWRHIRDLIGVNTHALRHRAGTAVYKGTGNDIRVTQEFLGHASPITTAIYVHVERDDLMKAGDASRMVRSLTD